MFFDTYAFIEIFEDAPAYNAYKNYDVICSKMNLLELHYSLLKKNSADIVDAAISSLMPNTVDVLEEDILEASKFKKQMKTKHLSYVDCLGYVIARRLHIPFLTGDKEFREIPNVEFVV